MSIVFAALAGLLLGLLFFGGLLLTTRALPRVRAPGLLAALSFLARMALLLAGLWWVGAGHWARMLACGLGVIAARPLLQAATRRQLADRERAS